MHLSCIRIEHVLAPSPHLFHFLDTRRIRFGRHHLLHEFTKFRLSIRLPQELETYEFGTIRFTLFLVPVEMFFQRVDVADDTL